MTEYYTGAQILSGTVTLHCEVCGYQPTGDEECWRLEKGTDGTRRTLAAYCLNCGAKIASLEPVAEAS